MARLASVYRYPIKSCLPIAESRCLVTSEGLAGDRRYMVVRPDGQFITARTHPQLQRVSVAMRPDGLTLQAPGMPQLEVSPQQFSGESVVTAVWRDSFTASATHEAYDAWFTALLGEPARLLWLGETSPRYRPALGQRVSFADGYPLLLLTSASLADLNKRTPEPQLMSQFRPNLVVSGTLPFAEDGWLHIRIGEVEFKVAKPCSRCVMTTLNAERGEYHPDREPLATLATYRRGGDGQIYFGQNLIPLNEGWLTAGDPVEILQTQPAPHYPHQARQVP
ncbi:MAG: MOSC domain-containing protein [Aeromonadaceae bacterium]